MLSILQKIALILFLIPSSQCWAGFGDQSGNWSTTESSDFRDYVVRRFNKRDSITNNYWAYFWLNQKVIELNLFNSETSVTLTPININDSSINAFAIPGNIIGIHQGLWAFADTESEFLSVLAHEMSHISLNHFSRLSENQSNQGWVLASGILLSILLAQENPEIANAALIGSLATVSQNNLNFSQAMELEADQLAQKMLANADYNSTSGRTFFQKLEQTSFTNDAYEFLRSHPLGTTRASRLSNNASNKERPLTSPTSFEIVRYFMLSKKNKKLSNPFSDTEITIDDTTNPNILFGWYKYQYDMHQDKNIYFSDITALSTQFRGFLPAQFERLKLMKHSNDKDLCDEFSRLTNAVGDQYLTLDVIEIFKEVSKTCLSNSALEWQARWFWQSGKEQQALALLTKSLSSELETNQLARIKSLLRKYNNRYERFR